VTIAHPRTTALSDPALPAVSTLLGPQVPPALEAAAGVAGGEISDAKVAQVSWWPGRSITVRYSVGVRGGALDGQHSFVCVTGRIPHGAMIVESDGQEVGVWRVPYDPALPGMASAVDHREAGQLLEAMGSEPGPVTTRLRAYRPRRRAVVEVKGVAHDIFLKVVRPKKVADLHRIHKSLSEAVPIPVSLGVDPDLGIVALQALPGITLRHTLEDAGQQMPSPEQLLALPRALPAPETNHRVVSAIERMPSTVGLLRAIAPELEPRLDGLRAGIGDDAEPAMVPSHGDYYEAQIMVRDGSVSGLLDVDTFGWGRAADDAATMLGHLSIWSGLSREPARVRLLASELLTRWSAVLDPVDLRLRTAAVVLSLASGPFRVQSAAWPSEVETRVRLAEKWLEVASDEDEKSLIPFSG
jgi:hypothetical protein